MQGLSFHDALIAINKVGRVEKAGGLGGWLEHLGSFVVDVLEQHAVDRVVDATKAVGNPPAPLARYADNYIGFDPSVEHPSGARGAHLFRFDTIHDRDQFIRSTGGDFTQAARIAKFDPDQARDEAGKWTSGGGADLKGYSDKATLSDGKIHTSNVDDAVRALSQGREVELNQPDEVSTLLDKLAAISKDAQAKGEQAPNYNLCGVSVEGTNLFCAGNKGIPRAQMPQLDDAQTEKFKEYLTGKGYSLDDEDMLASHMRATQNELNGAKVARFAQQLRADGDHDAKRLIVSSDNYILDGHHHWAAVVGLDTSDNHLGDLQMKVTKIDAPITDLLKEAKTFGARTESVNKYSPDQTRDERGRWSGDGGGADPALDLNHDGKPVYQKLNDACVHMANKIFPNGYDVTADAPNTFEGLVKHTAMTGRMAVWNGASDKTIFADDQANYAFRAWHDACHLRGLHPFTPEGEKGAFDEMVSDVHREYGDTPESKSMIGLLHEEIIGQLDYTKFHGGEFPVDQRAFAETYLNDPDGAVRMTFKFDTSRLETEQAAWGRLRDVGNPARHTGPSLLARLLAGRLNAVVRKYDPTQLRDDNGRWSDSNTPEAATRVDVRQMREASDDDVAWQHVAELTPNMGQRGGLGVSFASPSIHDKTLPEAVSDLTGPRQALFESAVRDVDSQLGVTGEQHGVVGAWKDGAENSTMLEAPQADANAVRVGAAMKGWLGQQKQVLVFKTSLLGPHTLYDMEVPGENIEQVHEELLKSGVPFHTLVPSAAGTRAIVVDTDGSLAKNVGDYAVSHNTIATRSTGHAEFMGDDEGAGSDAEQRDRARRAYEGVIQAGAASRYNGQSVGDIWKGVRDRWRSQLEAVKRFFLT